MAKLADLLNERERMHAYGLHHALALVDAEIARLSKPADAPATPAPAPADRKAPVRQTADAPTSTVKNARNA